MYVESVAVPSLAVQWRTLRVAIAGNKFEQGRIKYHSTFFGPFRCDSIILFMIVMSGKKNETCFFIRCFY